MLREAHISIIYISTYQLELQQQISRLSGLFAHELQILVEPRSKTVVIEVDRRLLSVSATVVNSLFHVDSHLLNF